MCQMHPQTHEEWKWKGRRFKTDPISKYALSAFYSYYASAIQSIEEGSWYLDYWNAIPKDLNNDLSRLIIMGSEKRGVTQRRGKGGGASIGHSHFLSRLCQMSSRRKIWSVSIFHLPFYCVFITVIPCLPCHSHLKQSLPAVQFLPSSLNSRHFLHRHLFSGTA